MKHIGLPLGWMMGMIIQLIFFPIFWKAYHFNGMWWVVQLTGLTLMFVLAVVIDRKVIFPWINKQWNVFKEWITKQLNAFVAWLNT